jgi:hypothetical protein
MARPGAVRAGRQSPPVGPVLPWVVSLARRFARWEGRARLARAAPTARARASSLTRLFRVMTRTVLLRPPRSPRSCTATSRSRPGRPRRGAGPGGVSGHRIRKPSSSATPLALEAVAVPTSHDPVRPGTPILQRTATPPPAPEVFDCRSHMAAPCATENDQHGDTANAATTTRHADPMLRVRIATSCIMMAQPQPCRRPLQ